MYEPTQDPYIIKIGKFEDIRGKLISVDVSHSLFEIKRVFVITSSDNQLSRGNHAHKFCRQLILVVGGNLLVSFKNASGSHELEVSEGYALMVPTWNWCSLRFENTQTIAVVLCSEIYDPGDYIEEVPLA